MLKTIAVLGGDARQRYLAERLMAGGFCVETYQVPGLPDSRTGLHAALSRAHAAALPMPALTKENWIRAEPRPIPLVSVLESLSPGTLVFGGPFEAAAETFAQYPVVLSDYTRSPALAAGNAVPTAEGAIQLAMERLPITLSGSRCLVVGFGRIGKALAARLRGLFAHVTVAARKPEDRALAAALGCTPETVCRYSRGLAQYDCIFSTVPAPVFRAEHLAAMRPDCLIVDLASSPGGLPADTAPFDAPVYLPAPGLPGKAAPATAAALLYDHILAAFAAAQP